MMLDERQLATGEDQQVREVGRTVNRLVSLSGVVRAILMFYYRWVQKVRRFDLLLIVYISDPFIKCLKISPNDVAN
jgi:hypothetical protein